MALEIMGKTSLERDMDKIKEMIKTADTKLLSYQELDFDSNEAKTKLSELLNDGVKREDGVPFLKEFLFQLERIEIKLKKNKEKTNKEITNILSEDKEQTPESIKKNTLSIIAEIEKRRNFHPGIKIQRERVPIKNLKEREAHYTEMLELIEKIEQKPNMTEKNLELMQIGLRNIIHFQEMETLRNLDSKISFDKGGGLILHTKEYGDMTFEKDYATHDEIKDIKGLKEKKNIVFIKEFGKEFILINDEGAKILERNGKKIFNSKQYDVCKDIVSSSSFYDNRGSGGISFGALLGREIRKIAKEEKKGLFLKQINIDETNSPLLMCSDGIGKLYSNTENKFYPVRFIK